MGQISAVQTKRIPGVGKTKQIHRSRKGTRHRIDLGLNRITDNKFNFKIALNNLKPFENKYELNKYIVLFTILQLFIINCISNKAYIKKKKQSFYFFNVLLNNFRNKCYEIFVILWNYPDLFCLQDTLQFNYFVFKNVALIAVLNKGRFLNCVSSVLQSI